MDSERLVRPSTGFKINDIPCDEDASERIVILFIYAAVVAMVMLAAVSGWVANSKLTKAREARVGRLEKRVEMLENAR